MQKIHYMFVVLGMLFSAAAYSEVQVSIGINLSSYPELAPMPGYPAYYAPGLGVNFFFYDGLYWVYQDDKWYASSWYNGPWWFVAPESVPLFVLRIPVQYYPQPPAFFLGWQSDAPPRWGDHWGHEWEQRRGGWDRWNHGSVPVAAPLPRYQRQYSGNRYPQQVEQQRDLQQQNYHYHPRDPEVRQRTQEQVSPQSPANQKYPQQQMQRSPDDHGTMQPDAQHASPTSQDTPITQQQGNSEAKDQKIRPIPRKENLEQTGQKIQSQQVRPEVQDRKQQPQPAETQRQQHISTPEGRTQRDLPHESNSRQEEGRGRDHKE